MLRSTPERMRVAEELTTRALRSQWTTRRDVAELSHDRDRTQPGNAQCPHIHPHNVAASSVQTEES